MRAFLNYILCISMGNMGHRPTAFAQKKSNLQNFELSDKIIIMLKKRFYRFLSGTCGSWRRESDPNKVTQLLCLPNHKYRRKKYNTKTFMVWFSLTFIGRTMKDIYHIECKRSLLSLSLLIWHLTITFILINKKN